jgi:hypothetical protein
VGLSAYNPHLVLQGQNYNFLFGRGQSMNEGWDKATFV